MKEKSKCDRATGGDDSDPVCAGEGIRERKMQRLMMTWQSRWCPDWIMTFFPKADQDKAMSYGVIALATIVLDEMVEKYLSGHPNTIVVNIASGLDTRCYRMQGKYVRWYNVDLPETMKIREKFLTENGSISQIAKSAMDASYIDDIEYGGENVLVIIEGLSMYLSEADVLQMMSIIEKTFQKVTVMIETMSPFVVKHIKEKSIEGSRAKFTWGVKNGKKLQRLVPAFTYKGEVRSRRRYEKNVSDILCAWKDSGHSEFFQ